MAFCKSASCHHVNMMLRPQQYNVNVTISSDNNYKKAFKTKYRPILSVFDSRNIIGCNKTWKLRKNSVYHNQTTKTFLRNTF